MGGGPFFSMIQQRQPGQPRMPEHAGAPPRPSMPNTTVTPPAVASNPVGRPPMPVPGFGSGGGSQPAANPASPMKSGGGARSTSPQVPNAGGMVTPTPAAAMPLMVAMDRMPSAAELATLPTGTSVQTPFGTVTQEGGLVPSPEGQMKYQQAIVQARKKFGPHPWANDTAAPPPPVRLGGASFNPFTGMWSSN